MVHHTGHDGAPLDPQKAQRDWAAALAAGYERGWKDNFRRQEMWNLFFFVMGCLLGLAVGAI